MKMQRDNSGVLFKNDKKIKETHADYTGTIRIDGQDFWLSAWIKEGNKGKFMSLAAKPKEEASTKPAPSTSRGQVDKGGMADMDSDIPF